MLILLSILAFLVIFTTLILVHEWGHFTAARKFGVRVEEFGLGLPPLAKVLTRDRRGTEYTLNWLPLGGFVRMKGEDTHDSKLLKAKDSFAAKAVWQRIIIVCAGVTMNLITGFVLLTLVFSLGSTYLVAPDKIQTMLAEKVGSELLSQQRLGILINDIASDSPAKDTDLKKFDFISAIDGQKIDQTKAFAEYVTSKKDQEVTLSIVRRSYEFPLTVKVGADGKLGVAISDALTAVKLRYPVHLAVVEGGKETLRITKLIFFALGDLGRSIFRAEVPQDIGGPIAIAKETFYRATDIIALINFAAMLSLTLAVFNILPIPALDGGRLIFLLYEGITRHRPSPAMEAKIHAAGFIFLIGLIILISFKDIFG